MIRHDVDFRINLIELLQNKGNTYFAETIENLLFYYPSFGEDPKFLDLIDLLRVSNNIEVIKWLIDTIPIQQNPIKLDYLDDNFIYFGDVHVKNDIHVQSNIFITGHLNTDGDILISNKGYIKAQTIKANKIKFYGRAGVTVKSIATSMLDLYHRSFIEGDIYAENIKIKSSTIKGNVFTNAKLKLNDSKIYGNIIYQDKSCFKENQNVKL